MAIHEKFGRGRYVLKPNDKVFTPRKLAKQLIDWTDIPNNSTVLDAFAGDGAFYDQYPSNVIKDWSELDKGRDFFDVDKHYDYIVTNPPYSIYDEVMEHSMKITNNIVYLVPLSKVVSSLGRMRKINNYGGVKKMIYFGAGKANFPFGFPCVMIHIQKGYTGKIEIKEL